MKGKTVICFFLVIWMIGQCGQVQAEEHQKRWIGYCDATSKEYHRLIFEPIEGQRFRMKHADKLPTVGIKVEDHRFVVRVFEKSIGNARYVDIAFDKQGVNQIYGMHQITYADGTSFPVTSDWLGPYQVASKQVSQKTGVPFTGGYHGSNGDGTGTATARTTRIQWSLDGQRIEEQSIDKNEFCYGEELKLDVVNCIQAGDRQEDVLREIQQYTFGSGHINVGVITTALAEAHILRYYGLQAQINLWQKHTYYIYDNGAIDENGTTWESQSLPCQNVNGLRLNTMGVFDDGFKHGLLMTLFDTGLGDYAYVQKKEPMGFEMSYGKIYYNLIQKQDVKVSQGQSLYWKGCYTFVTNKTVYDWYRNSLLDNE